MNDRALQPTPIGVEAASLVVRPVRHSDLPALERLAEVAVPRLTNLPAHRDRLEERIICSNRAFSSELGNGKAGNREVESSKANSSKMQLPGNELYTFVLEDLERQTVVGTAGIRALAGARDTYYTYRQETLIHASHQLNVRREVQTLALSNEVSDTTLLCALSLDPHYQGSSAASLLRRARLMFIAQYPERFADILAVAFPGFLDTQGESPFWDSVGRHFFVRSYQEINHIAGVRSKSFIAEVMPQFPLYLPLLTPQARAAIGREHSQHEPALQEMLAEGFQRSRHVDIFDAGPVIKRERLRLETLRRASWHPVRIRPAESLPDAEPALIANQKLEDFRCTVAGYALSPTGQLMLSPEHAQILGVEEGRAILAAPLNLSSSPLSLSNNPPGLPSGADKGEL